MVYEDYSEHVTYINKFGYVGVENAFMAILFNILKIVSLWAPFHYKKIKIKKGFCFFSQWNFNFSSINY